MRGNVIDMAVGVVIGGAFGKIVSSFVADVIMPVISILTGGIDFTAWKIVLKQAITDGGNVVSPEVAINYGTFIQVILDFIIIVFVIFFFVKGVNKFKRKEEAAPAAPAEPSEEVLLLREIRDSLKK